MKIRENTWIKVLAFLLAVTCFSAAAVLGYFQIMNWDALWADGSVTSSDAVLSLERGDKENIETLLDYYLEEEQGTVPVSYYLQKKNALEQALSADSTNLRWCVTEEDGTVRYGNVTALPDGGTGVYTALYLRDEAILPDDLISDNVQERELVISMWVDQALAVEDQYSQTIYQVQALRSHRAAWLAVTIACVVVGLVLAGLLCWAAGHKKETEGIYLNWFHRIPGDLLVFVLFLAFCVLLGLFLELPWSYYYDNNVTNSISMTMQLVIVGSFAAAESALCGGALLTIAARCKARTSWKDTLIYRLGRWLIRETVLLVAAIPLIWKVVLLGLGYILFTALFWSCHAQFVWLVGTLAAWAWCCLWAYQWKRVRQGAHEIVSGTPDYHIDTAQMLPDLKAHANELNDLNQAISSAVDQRMKSERFKAELITNVSHDLKTPLTSIISYVDLLKKEDIQDPKAAEYIQVLDRKSQRLKKLTEDLVEASKASTGSLSVSLERVELRMLADQALAEYAQRLEEKGLTVVRAFPEDEVWVRADGRHLWRVLDNLLSNCAKYALRGTRVYVEVRAFPDSAALWVKNISRDALNVPPEALMERFVRGDESRTTEGSGLGLSIAQSLTELQNGRFDVSIDGDLFKATVTLPLAGS